jgi:hypothetical protein
MSPELKHRGTPIDIGLFAESLAYYDCVLVALPHKWAFTEFVSWFVRHSAYDDLIALLRDEVVRFYYYSFFASSVEKDGEFSIWNLQEERAARLPTFERDCLTTASLRPILPHANQRAKLIRAARGKVIEAKADDFGPAIENARRDYHDPDRCALLIQAFLDEVYPILGLRKPPVVRASVTERPEGKVRIAFNIDLNRLGRDLGKDLGFTTGHPLTAAARCNRFLWSAAQLGCDLYLHSPMSTLIGDKLYETGERLNRTERIVDQLVAEVEFPDVRQLVNDEKIGLSKVLLLRKKSRRFRQWLQDESERDRNALVAYHTEVAKESGWTRAGWRALALFGILGGAAVAGAIGGAVAGVRGAIIGAGAEAGLVYVFDLASKLNVDWRPVVFGSWARDRIRKQLLREQTE